MTGATKVSIWVVALILLVTAGIMTSSVIRKRRRITLNGAVIRQDSDFNKQVPIEGAQVTAITDEVMGPVTTDGSGRFLITLPRGFRRRQPIKLQFRKPGYQPLELSEFISDQIYIARMEPIGMPEKKAGIPGQPQQVISNVKVRYLVKATTEANVGSTVKTFQVENKGNIPCKGQPVCSPDRKWKANTSSAVMDAGQGNEFRNLRISCIAGPCPFTSVEQEVFSNDGRTVTLVARDWSDTATFLVEAEVVHPMVSDTVREAYPVIFGPALSFSVPQSSEGPSLEAELNGDATVFPLGPNLSLSWAQCTDGHSKDLSTVFRCELKPGYRFR